MEERERLGIVVCVVLAVLDIASQLSGGPPITPLDILTMQNV